MGNLHYTLQNMKKDDEYDGYEYDEDFFTFDSENTFINDRKYSSNQGCNHKWKWYMSLFPHGSFQYCEHCDAKKDKGSL